MKSLAFAFAGSTHDGKRVRGPRFEERSSLPVSAACVVASGMRETLAALFGAAAAVRLLEAVIPSPEAWSAIVRGALLYRVRGSIADAAIVLRPADAIALAAAAFGETAEQPHAERALSPIERDLLDRVAGAVAGSLAAVCGARERDCVERVHAIGGFISYFELLLEQPVEARIGIALSRDPAPEPHGRLTIGDLADLDLPATISLDLGTIEAAAIASLARGAFVPITRSNLFHGSLSVNGRTIARGTCGVRSGRYALVLK